MTLAYSQDQNRLAERFQAGEYVRHKGRLGTFICPRSGFQWVGEEPRRAVLIHVIGHDRCSIVAADEVDRA